MSAVSQSQLSCLWTIRVMSWDADTADLLFTQSIGDRAL